MNDTTTTDPAALRWRWCHFDELGVAELQYIYMARQLVFSIEQECVYLDADGCDERSFHLAAWSPTERVPLAYARVVEPGVKYAEASIGRVITTANARGTGLGRELLKRTLAHAALALPGQALRISAQTRLEAFYRDFGFVAQGEPYLEDGIPHTQMLRAAAP